MTGPISFAELTRGWSTKCSLCGKPCFDRDVKELALGHATHWMCYDKWLESQDDGAWLTAKLRSLAVMDKARIRMDEWVASARWIRVPENNSCRSARHR